MAKQVSLTTNEIQTLFTEEISALGGTISDTYHDGTRLFLRSVLPQFREVRRKDQVQCGVALRVMEQEVRVHPYIFRLVCKNGAIWAHALQTQRIENFNLLVPERAEVLLREAIHACASEEAFETATQEMRSAQDREADFILNLLPMLSQMPSAAGRRMLSAVLRNFREVGDTTRFGLMNAITAVARDTEDPDERWQLEEFGGGVPVAVTPPVRDARGMESLIAAYLAEMASAPPDQLCREFDQRLERERERVLEAVA